MLTRSKHSRTKQTEVGNWYETSIFLIYPIYYSAKFVQFSTLETGSPEEEFRTDALEVLSNTFQTLNTVLPLNEERHQVSQRYLDDALKRAIERYDLRSQLDLYDKLVEVSFPSPINAFCCFRLT